MPKKLWWTILTAFVCSLVISFALTKASRFVALSREKPKTVVAVPTPTLTPFPVLCVSGCSFTCEPTTCSTTATTALTFAVPRDPIDLPAASPPPDPPPSPIVVGPYIYRISYRDAKTMPSYEGQTYHDSEVILLRRDLGPGELRETLFHELEHCAMYIGTSGEEYVLIGRKTDAMIEANAPVMVEVLRDNPALVRWLTRKTK